MIFLSRAFSLDDEGKLRKLTFFRLVVATIVIGVAIMVLQLENKLLSIFALYSLLGAIFITTGSTYLAFRSGASFRSILWIHVCADIAVLTLIVHFSGGSNSYFAILYILPILAGGIYLQLSGGLTSAMLAASAYIVYSVLEIGGYVHPPYSWTEITASGFHKLLLKGYLHIAVFVFAGFLSGYVSRHVKNKGRELGDRERELRRIQLNTDKIINNMSSGLIVTNMGGEIVSINPAARSILCIPDGEDVDGCQIEDVIPMLGALARELSWVRETGNARKRHELEMVRADGSVLPIGLNISVLRGEDGEKQGVIALFQDLTEVHEMAEKVRQADKMAAIGELSAAIAHEIRAPLASICGSIDMLAAELELSGENSKLMDLVMKESDRLDSIITDFLDYARQRKPRLMPFEAEECIREVMLLLRHSNVFKNNISINLNNICGDARFFADEEQIRQVFLNLGLNACEAMRRGGTLDVRISRIMKVINEADRTEECIRVEFENNGPPVPPDILPHVFEPFFTTKEGGTGLGLATAERIIESNQGSIEVVSSVTTGTVFSVVLPSYTGKVSNSRNILKEEFIGF